MTCGEVLTRGAVLTHIAAEFSDRRRAPQLTRRATGEPLTPEDGTNHSQEVGSQRLEQPTPNSLGILHYILGEHFISTIFIILVTHNTNCQCASID